MGCGIKCIKIILVVLNVVFWLIGLGLLAVGIWIKVDQAVTNVAEALNIGLSEPAVEIVTWMFIGAGIYAFIVGFFGCCGAIRESACMLGFYIFCLFLLFAVELGAAIYIGIRFDKIKTVIKEEGESWIKDNYDSESKISKGLNYVQFKFCCCGINDYRDYEDSKYLESSSMQAGAYLSEACCKPKGDEFLTNDKITLVDFDTCQTEALKMSKNNKDPESTPDCDAQFRPTGCFNALGDAADRYMIPLIAVGAGVAFIQLVVFILAVVMCISVRRSDGKAYKN